MRPDEVDMRLFLDEISEKSEDEVRPRMHLDKPFVQNLRSGTKWLHVCCLVLTDQEKNLKISALMHVKYRGIWKRFVKYIYLAAKSRVLVHMGIFVLRLVCVRGHNSWSIHSKYKWLHYLDILSHCSLRLKQNTASPVTSSSKFGITSSVG